MEAIIVDRGAVAAARGHQTIRLVDVLCRSLDIVLSGLLLVALTPLFLLIALAIRLDSRGPVVFRQRRCARDMKLFTVSKFRTMHHGVDQDTHRNFVLGLIAGEQPESSADGPRFKLATDERVTRVGRLLRRWSLDELPQFWNVLRGDMSLVGPRPPIPYEVEHYPAHWFARFAVKPGVTGLWQVSGRSDLPLEDMIALDVQYIQRRSLRLNVSILLRTIPAVLSGKGASCSHRSPDPSSPGRGLAARLLSLLAILAVPAALSLISTPAAMAAEVNCAAAANPIVCENAQPGTPPSEWQVSDVGSSDIQGYATSMGVNVGETESFKINTTVSSYHINILRLGYYGGDGARTIATSIPLTVQPPQKQPACLTNSTTGLIDCGNWAVSASWKVPTTAVSGVYIAPAGEQPGRKPDPVRGAQRR